MPTMARSVQPLAFALICTVLINVICAAPVSMENDIDSLFDNTVEERVTNPAILQSSATEDSPIYSSGEATYVRGCDVSKVPEEPSSICNNKGREPTDAAPSYIPDDTPSSTTEHPHNIIGKIFAAPTDRPGRIQFSGGVHKFRINAGEDETERLLQEYNYHFVRVEQNLPHTTLRQNRYRPPSKK